MISKRISGRKDGKSSASTALRYGEGLIPDRETGEFLDKSHRTRFGNFGIIDDGVYAGRNLAEMARIIELAAIEMQATCDLNTRVGEDKKLAHFVVSFNQYKPSEAVLRDVEDSMLAAMKLDKNHFATFVHNDNGYWHMHIPPDHIIRAEANRRSLAAQGSSGMHELPIGGLDAERKIAGMLLPHALPNGVGNKQARQDQDLRHTGPSARRRRSAGEYASTTGKRSQLPLIVTSSVLTQQAQRGAVPAAERVAGEARDMMSEQCSPLTERDQALAARIEQAIEKNDVFALEKCWNEIGSPKREAAHAIGAAQSAPEHESHTARYDALLNLSNRLERTLKEHKENEIFKQGGRGL